MTVLRIGIGGFNGQMSKAIQEAAQAVADIQIVGGVVRPGSTIIADRSLIVTSEPEDLTGLIDLFVDVSSAEAMSRNLEAMVDAGVPYLTGVTGLEPPQMDAIDQAAAAIPVLQAANFSVGVALVTSVLETVSRALPDADIEIVETHHRRKRDAPSGTALVFIDAIAGAREAESTIAMGRSGAGTRSPGEIGVHSLRGGGNPGEHRVFFLLEGEEIVIEHRAFSRAAYAGGALQAARWLSQRPPGRYSMQDVVASIA